MGAHHAGRRTSTTVGVRATATAAAVVALTGAGAGLAVAHDGPDGGPGGDRHGGDGSGYRGGQGGCGLDGFVDRMTDEPLSSVGLSRAEAAGTCADPSSLGGFDRDGSADDGYSVGWADQASAYPGQDGPRADERTVPAQQSPAQQGAQARPAARAQPKQPSSIDTPPPLGQTRIIKLPTPR